MDMRLFNLWAKTDQKDQTRWHPLILHMLDVAACADAILEREPQSTRDRMARLLGMGWEHARPWLLLIIACHDLGKACPGFQCKWSRLLMLAALSVPKSPDTKINHAYVSQIALAETLQEMGWPYDLTDLVADAVGCHHGARASHAELYNLSGNRRALGIDDWRQARRHLVEMAMAVFNPTQIPVIQTLDGPDFMLLSGLTSFADWIGSNEAWFPFGTINDCEGLSNWYLKRGIQAKMALDAIGWQQRTPLVSEKKTFEEMFNFNPRPLQQAVVDVLAGMEAPSILLLEAPMGEGKTEAAFFAHAEMQRRFGHRGLYIALPTKATGNAMFQRTLDFLHFQGGDRCLDIQLLHGATLLNETFQNLRISGIHDQESGGEIRAGEWFTNKKRALLSEYGVGTVDQAILPILPVRHNFVRLWGLANRVVVFDEIHAYDAYTGTLLVHLLRWLLALGSSIVLLSATLSPSIRCTLAGIVDAVLPSEEPPYPRLSVFHHTGIIQRHFAADPARRKTIQLQGITADLPSLRAALNEHLAGSGLGLALVNTVQRAQDLYRLFPDGEPLVFNNSKVGKRLLDGTEVYLFHARFPAFHRQVREDQVLGCFGEKSERDKRRILIATQVAEQSLDLDFDLIVTDLAPIDLILQRAGRLWRHTRETRPVLQPLLIVAGLVGNDPPPFGKPLWWGSVYREDVLIRTWCLLRHRQEIILPDEIDTLVQVVYEEQVDIPASLQERLYNAMINSEGDEIARRGEAHKAIIGLPDDASWNDPSRFVLYDEDEPGVHRVLLARTRLGEESVIAIPILPHEDFHSDVTPDFIRAKTWFLRGATLSNPRVVKKCKSMGIPEGWKKSALLRNCYPLVMNNAGRWILDEAVSLDDDLGFVYETKEDR